MIDLLTFWFIDWFYQEHKITGSRLEHMSESDLENLGIPKVRKLWKLVD